MGEGRGGREHILHVSPLPSLLLSFPTAPEKPVYLSTRLCLPLGQKFTSCSSACPRHLTQIRTLKTADQHSNRWADKQIPFSSPSTRHP